MGNHDLPNVVSRATAVEIFATLQVPHVTVGDSLRTYTVATKAGPLQVLAVPWPRRSSAILAREETRGLSIERCGMRLSAVDGWYRRPGAGIGPRATAILTGHVMVNGATVGTERSMMLGQDHVLLASALHRPEVDYVALGHVHKHQVLRREPPMMTYSGSLQRVDFSEEGDDKGFCVVDLDPDAPQGQRLAGFEFQQVAARPFVTVDVNVPSVAEDPTGEVLRAIARKDVNNAVSG